MSSLRTTMPAPSPAFATILADTTRYIPGNNFLEDSTNPANRSLPGVSTLKSGGYLTTDIRRNIRWVLQADKRTWLACPIYQSDEEGWHHVPSPRVMRRRARGIERRKERQGWMGSLVEPTEALPLL
jgi:hypothetical protein